MEQYLYLHIIILAYKKGSLERYHIIEKKNDATPAQL